MDFKLKHTFTGRRFEMQKMLRYINQAPSAHFNQQILGLHSWNEFYSLFEENRVQKRLGPKYFAKYEFKGILYHLELRIGQVNSN